jgi:subtilisin family serine protease
LFTGQSGFFAWKEILSMQSRTCSLAPAIFLIACGICLAAPESTGKGKIRVETLDDLPRMTYAIEGSASGLLQSDAFSAFAARVRKDQQRLLDDYDIQDPTTLQTVYSTLGRIDFLAGDYDSALAWSERGRALEDKEANRLTAGLTLRAWVQARRVADETGNPAAFGPGFADELGGLLGDLPWDVVRDNVKGTKGYAEYISGNLLLGIVQTEIDPVVEKTGQLTEEMARRLVDMRYTLEMFLPVREEVAAVYGHYISQNRVEKEDIWGPRAITLTQEDGAVPVTVAIWDSGVDSEVFRGHLWINESERFDGADTDGNGFVDDVHGIGFDVNGFRTPELLHPEGDMAGRVESTMEYMKGFMDLIASIDSPEASTLKTYVGNLAPDQVHNFLEALNFGALYAHGTHVAGIAIEGNPYARVLISRYTFDYHEPRRLLTREIAERHARSFQDAVDYFRAAGVRTANMSWGWTLKEVEGVLESNGVTDPEERAALTRELFGILRKGLHDALASAPEILFVAAAGNDDNDVNFDEMIPASFELPNLMVVAAVDQAGDPTNFTSGGRNVVVYANGFEVDSYVPGGERMAFSGTSMASPNVVNLAAKLFALDPELTPVEVKELIINGATPRGGEEDMLLIHPRRSADLLHQL